jgi:hypothetical protein
VKRNFAKKAPGADIGARTGAFFSNLLIILRKGAKISLNWRASDLAGSAFI